MKNISKKNQKKAFSLTELTIVIIIISVFISAIISASIFASNNAKITVTKNRMNEIYKALGSYAVANGRLPCPAPITDVKGSDNYGNNMANGLGSCYSIANNNTLVSGTYKGIVTNIYYSSTSLIYGMIPVQNLKLSSEMAEDGFGTKFSYVVDMRFTGFNDNGDVNNNFKNAPKESSSISSVIAINEVYGDATQPNTVLANAAFVIVSHGANKSGGFNASSSTQNSRSSDNEERHNDLGDVSSHDFDSLFISLSDKSDIFDDIIFFKTKKNIMTDFNLLSLVPCQPTGTNYNDVYVDNLTPPNTATWLETDYGQVAVSLIACDRSATNYNGTVVYPTKKCGPFGVWEDGAIDSCQSQDDKEF